MRLATRYDYQMFLQILTEAEQRVKDFAGTQVAVNSAETVALCNERLAIEGMTRAELKHRAKET